MFKCDAQSMKMKTCCRGSAVEHVSDDRTSKSEGVGAVNAQLMCASGMWVQEKVCGAVRVFSSGLIFGISRLSLFDVYFLSRPFIIIR